MKGVVQDPIHHAEGDVWIHTKMVCEAMAGLPAFRALPETQRRIAFAGALLHDVAKPTRTQVGEDGRVTSKGHSTHGAMLARRILWQQGVAFAEREQVVALVRHHQEPFWLIEREDPLRLVAASSQRVGCDLLALLAEADARGRTCDDQKKILDAIELYRAYAEEQGCLSTPYAFPSAHARFLYLGGRQSQATHAPHESFRCEVTLMSGFPGAGKDRWVAAHAKDLPVVSLDRLRDTLDVDPEDEQGTVVQAAREEARDHLRAGRSFVWNATNLSRRIRGQCIRLFADYDAKIRIVYVEVPEPVLHAQNKARAKPVPSKVLEALLDRWEVPDPGEAHDIEWVVSNEA
jgi:putative nucleotidyltransferase with HDIG domain